jgi:tetratricopeptide (TPR) repeat protein
MKRPQVIPSILGALLGFAGCLPVAAIRPQQVRELSVFVLADEEFRHDPGWKSSAESVLKAASSYFEKISGLRLTLSEFTDWMSDNALDSVEMLAENLATKIGKGTYDIIVAFSGQKNLDTGHDACTLFREGIVVLTGTENRGEMIRSLEHETGHLFAAAHVENPESLMDIFSRGREFDSRNIELIRLNRERSFHGSRFPLPKACWERTAALWREVARSNAIAQRREMMDAQGIAESAAAGARERTRRRDLDDVHLLLAQVLIEQDQYAEALGECGEALRINPESIEALNLSGIALRRSGRVDEAIEKYLAVLDQKPGQAQALYNLGIAYSKKGALDKAEESYERAVEARPRFAEALSNLGELYLRLDRVSEAESQLRQAVEADPQFPPAYTNLAELAFRREDYGQSMELVDKGLTLDPESPGAHNMRGKILRQRKDLAGAKEEFTKALLIRPNDEKALHNLGNCYLDEKNVAEAKKMYARAAEIDPRFAEPHEGLGLCWLLEDKLDEAIREFRLALQMGLHSESLHVNLSSAFLWKGRLDEAADEARKALEVAPLSASAHNNLGMAFVQTGALAEAAAEFSASLDCDPENKDALLNLGNLFLGQENWGKALEFYLRDLAVDPLNGVLHNNIAVVYFKQGEYAKSWTHLQKAEELGVPPHPAFREELKRKIKGTAFQSSARMK